jgi:hypothetical protein
MKVQAAANTRCSKAEVPEFSIRTPAEKSESQI